MCLYPKLIENPKYKVNKKNGGNPPPIKDARTKYVPIGCGKCMECKKQKSREWAIRLQEEIRTDSKGKFITLSFTDESLNEIDEEVQTESYRKHKEINETTGKKTKWHEITGYELENEIATYAIRHFLENWRKKTGKSIKHWLITELGHLKTERIHIHGLIFTDDLKTLQEKWKYGRIWVGSYVNEKTINYIVKYVNKTDAEHKGYNAKIYSSNGIGKGYLKRPDSENNKYKNKETREYYKTRQGIKLNLPKYYRNKIYNEEEKEKLWINLLDKEERYVNGIKVNISKGEDDYNNIVKHARQINKILGYGSNEIKKEDKIYEQQRRNIQRWTRKKKLDESGANAMPTKKNKQPSNKNKGTNEIDSTNCNNNNNNNNRMQNKQKNNNREKDNNRNNEEIKANYKFDTL